MLARKPFAGAEPAPELRAVDSATVAEALTEALASLSLEIVQLVGVDPQIEVTVRYPQPWATCPACQAATAQVHSRRVQRKRDRDLQGKAVWLLLVRRRFRCWRCGKVFMEPDPACGLRYRSTRRFREGR